MATLAYPEIADYYSSIQIQTAGKQKTICMLHEKCVQFISAALDIEAQRRTFLIRAQNILSQLQMSLIRNDAVSHSLFLLYDYCYVLLEHNGNDDLTNAGEILAIVRDTFKLLDKRPR
jgi:flagellar biosynthetic protein FliS